MCFRVLITKCQKYRRIFGVCTVSVIILQLVLLSHKRPAVLPDNTEPVQQWPRSPLIWRPKTPGHQDSWQSVNGLAKNDDIYVFSAFYDNREPDKTLVRIISMCTQGSFRNLGCTYYKEDMSILGRGEIKENFYEGSEGRKYATCILSCLAPVFAPNQTVSVSLISNTTQSPTHLLRVRNIQRRLSPPYNFTVCLAPINRLYGDHSDNTFQYGEFLEFMEVNSMFGADRFVMYNVSTGRSIGRHLRAYQREGKLHVIDWKLPVGTEDDRVNEVFYFAQTVALNDCVYRYMYTSRYVVVIDLDELVVPLKTSTWGELLSSLPGYSDVTIFSFQNTFFRKEFTPDPEAHLIPLVGELKLRSLMYTKREDKIWGHGQRSKYIARTDMIKVATAHSLLYRVSGNDFFVATEDALLFHYRNWLLFVEANRTDVVVNRRMYDFKDEILKRIRFRHSGN